MTKLFLLTVLIYYYCTICISTPSPTSPSKLPDFSCTIDAVKSDCTITCSIERETYTQHFGTTFNLCPLKLHGDSQGQINHYEVHDSRFEENQDIYQYKYYFNIAHQLYDYPDTLCHNISKLTSRGYCVEGNICNDTDLISITNQSWAYQIIYDSINNTVKDCYRLSDENGGSSGPTYTFINEVNPTKGIQITYHNGDWCGDENVKENRHFHIQLLCENEMFFIPENELLSEDEKCHYIVSVASIYGCPAECLVYDGSLCAGNGLCGYDYTNMISRCFCYHTFGGDACKDSDDDILNVTQKIHPNMESRYVRLFTADVDVTYDISPYQPTDDLFVVNDKDPENTKYNYYLGILDNIIPTENPALSACNSSGYAFQIDTVTNSCYVLGTEYEWTLYNEYNDPSKGVTIKYTNGTDCDIETREFSHIGQGTKPRTLSISFVCPDDIEEFYDPSNIITTYVEENEFCEYSMIIETTIACPFQCKTSLDDGFTVCSQHGICSADPYAGFVRCLCDDGYQGIDCNEHTHSPPKISTTEVNKTDSSAHYAKIARLLRIVLIVVVILFILIVIGGAIAIYKCYKKWKMKTFVLQDRLSEYEQMEEEDNDIPIQQQQINDNAEESDSVR